MRVVEIRDLDGPNIFLLEPAIKLEIDLEDDGESAIIERLRAIVDSNEQEVGPALLAAVGAGSAKAPEEGTGKEVHLRRGSSAFLGASCRSYALRGPGTVYRVLYPGSGIGAAQASRSIP